MTDRHIPNTPDDLPPDWQPAPEPGAGHDTTSHRQNGHTAPRPPAPHDLNLERHLIAAALNGLDDTARRLTTQVDATDLYGPAHQTIWVHIAAITEEGGTPDTALLNRRLADHHQLDHIGGTPGLLDIAATTPNTANADTYAHQIVDLAHRRRTQHRALALAEAARDGTDTTHLVDQLATGTNTPAAERLRSALLDTQHLRAIPPPRPLITGWLNLDSLAMLYGRSGAYKTFLGLDIAAHIATGTWWHSHAVTPAPVLYVIAEGVSGLSRRIDAWQAHHETHLDRHQPLHWLPQAVNLTDRGDVEALATVAADLTPAPGLIVLDTLARCINGAEENSAPDMGLVVTNLDRIRRATGACVLVVHHAGKDGTLGARGSSALRAAMDTELELSKTDDRIQLKSPKQKDMPEPAGIALGLLPVDPSIVLVPAHESPDADDITARTAEVLDALAEIATAGGVSFTTWRDHALESGLPKATFTKARKILVDRSLVSNVGTEKRPLYIPAEQDIHIEGL